MVPKKKKERVVSMGKHRKSVLALWTILFCSIGFGIFKNFTAIDQHTTHEKVVVKEKVLNTSGVENFTIDFAKVYFSWKNDKKVIENRMSTLEQYLTEAGLILSQDMVRVDIPTSSEVESIKILNVEKRTEEFEVSFLLNQKITEGKETQQVVSAYRVTVFEDKKGNRIVTGLPTMIRKPGKAEYQGKQLETDSRIDAKTTDEITDFLETFFKLYPTASKKELEYYVDNEAMQPIETNLKFVEIGTPVYQEKGGIVQVAIAVKYLDNTMKAINNFTFDIFLQKEGNWKIIDSN